MIRNLMKCLSQASVMPAIALLAVAWPVSSQAVENEFGLWAIFTTTDSFPTANGDSQWRYWFDGQLRYYDVGSGINQYVLRPGIGYDVSDNMTAWAGYGYFHSHTASGATVTENRFWQQLTWNAARFGGGTLSMRARLEERSLSRGDDLGWVLRYMAKYVHPIGASQKTELILGLEPFFDLVDTDWGGDAGLASLRSAIGVGWKVSPKLAIEAGYMNQYIFNDNGEDLDNHLGVVNFKVKF